MTDAQRTGFRVPDDDVVQQIDVDDLGGLPQDTRDLKVSRAGCRITGGMIVGDHQGRGASKDGSAKDLPGRRQRRRGRAQRNHVAGQWHSENTPFGFAVRTRRNVFQNPILSVLARQMGEREAMRESILAGVRVSA